MVNNLLNNEEVTILHDLKCDCIVYTNVNLDKESVSKNFSKKVDLEDILKKTENNKTVSLQCQTLHKYLQSFGTKTFQVGRPYSGLHSPFYKETWTRHRLP